MPEQPLLSRLRAGELTLMMGIRSARTPDAVRIAGATGHHAVMVDLEHSAMSVDAAAQLAATAHDIGLVPLVRIPEREYGVIGRLLDGGAQGIVAPRVETAEQALAITRACRFAPRGHDDDTVVVMLLETPAGLANAGQIAALDGVDMLAIGANDLTAELGAPGRYDDPRVSEAVSAAAEACRRHGKLLMIGGVADLPMLGTLAGLGACPLYLTGTDSDLLYAGSLARAHQFTEWFGARP
jgi:2-keto-3-deoxy-L-rhamnonate aldolase RhmA